MYSWLLCPDSDVAIGGYDIVLLKNALCACEEQRRRNAWESTSDPLSRVTSSLANGFMAVTNSLTGHVDRTCGGFGYESNEDLLIFENFIEAVKGLVADNGIAILVNDNGKPIPEAMKRSLRSSSRRSGGWHAVNDADREGSMGWRGQADRPLWVFTKGAWV